MASKLRTQHIALFLFCFVVSSLVGLKGQESDRQPPQAGRAEANAKQHAGSTGLILAADNGDIEMVRALLAGGSDVNAKGPKGSTALIAAASRGHRDVVEALLASGASVNAKRDDGVTPLMAAARQVHPEIVGDLVAARADVNARDKDGETALIYAASLAHPEVIERLLAAGADVNAKRKDGVTALMAAARQGHADVVKALLAAKADVNAKNSKAQTALMIAAHNAHNIVVGQLLAAGADPDTKAGRGMTASIQEKNSNSPIRAENTAGKVLIYGTGELWLVPGGRAHVQAAVDGVAQYLISAGFNVITPPDDDSKLPVPPSELLETSDAASVLQVDMHLGLFQLDYLVIECIDREGKVLWREQAPGSVMDMTPKGATHSMLKNIKGKLERHIGQPGLPKSQ